MATAPVCVIPVDLTARYAALWENRHEFARAKIFDDLYEFLVLIMVDAYVICRARGETLETACEFNRRILGSDMFEGLMDLRYRGRQHFWIDKGRIVNMVDEVLRLEGS